MQALLEYVQTSSIPLNLRPNVSDDQVRSITLGAVNRRQNGYGISGMTCFDNMKLLRQLIALTHDSSIIGERPASFTSICVNVNFACGLHVDKFKLEPAG